MKSMADPDYRYRPWPEERRERARQAALQRLGSPPGFHMIHGVPVPQNIWKDIRDIANAYHYGRDGKKEPLWKTRAVIIVCVDLLQSTPFVRYTDRSRVLSGETDV